MEYEELLEVSDQLGLIVKEKPLKYNDGRIKGNRVAIRKDLDTTAKKACVLAEEIGHFCTASGAIIDQSLSVNRKAELKGRIWAYNKQIGLQGIIACHKNRCHTLSDMAEYLNVTELFLSDAISCYKMKYGLGTQVDNYIIGFEPNLYVIELIN